MKIFNNKEIKDLANILKNDGVVSVPTDTVYGLCARINSKVAFDKLVEVKNRPSNKSFPILCLNESQIREIAIVDEKIEKLIRAFMPGPITLVLNKKDKSFDTINNKDNTLAIRMAPTKELEELIEYVGSPLFLTSANSSGQDVCKSLDEIKESCPKLDAILEGNSNFGVPSTIVNCTKDNIIILREGPITLQQIEDVLKK